VQYEKWMMCHGWRFVIDKNAFKECLPPLLVPAGRSYWHQNHGKIFPKKVNFDMRQSQRRHNIG
jgi:hypothetical protein